MIFLLFLLCNVNLYKFFLFMAKMLSFNVSLVYIDETKFRPIATGCSESQVIDVLLRHLRLADVNRFVITPIVSETPFPFREYTL